MSEIVKSAERLAILEKIKQYEIEGRFDEDVENDPPTRQLEPGEVDYTQKKLSTRLASKFAFKQAEKFLDNIIKTKQFILKDVIGAENIKNLDSGAIITCNHFNAFDSFAVEYIYRSLDKKIRKKRKFFRVIREGNYTNFPGFFGMLMRKCNTLPLSSNPKVMTEFLRAVDQLLKDGHFVLVYPEQSMWWNYRKPKPLKKGAFQFAVRANVPVLPCFITMNDSDIIGSDGFPVQEYTIHMCKPIYPDKDKSSSQNIKLLMEENYQIWKDIYENTYGIPLTYLTEDNKENTSE